MITETEEIALVLDAAARRWPGESRAKLLMRLVEEGHRAVAGQCDKRASAQRDAVLDTSGALTGVYGPAYLPDLREDWPA